MATVGSGRWQRKEDGKQVRGMEWSNGRGCVAVWLLLLPLLLLLFRRPDA